jgi:hypothetical protein
VYFLAWLISTGLTGVEKDVPGERLEARALKELARVPASGAQDENVFHLLAAELI